MGNLKFDEWKKVDLRIGKVKSVKDHPNADKLYIIMVDLGEGEHDIQIVSGLKEHYDKDDLLDKQIVVIKNLEPVMLRGVESQGMLLAGVFKEKVVLLQPDKEIETGSKVE